MKSLVRPAVLAAAVLASAAPAAAQDPRPLSLEQAVDVARENNPAYRKALTEVQSAAAERRAGWGAFLPNATLSLSTGAGFYRTVSGVDDFGIPRDTVIVNTFETSSASQSISLGNLTLFDGGATLHEYRATRRAYQAAEAGASAEEVRMRGEVARRYWAAWRTGEAIRLEERLLEAAREQAVVTEQLLRVAQGGPVELLGAELEVAKQEQELERARGEHQKALLALQEQMGVFGDEPLALADAPGAPFSPATLDAAALVARALENNPRLDRRRADEHAAQSRMRAARAARWPTLSMGASAGRNETFSGLGGLKEYGPQNRSVGFNVSLSFPLFDRFRTSAAIARAEAALSGARQDARAERLALEKEVREALVELENAYRAAGNAERTLSLARERLELATEEYRLGAKSFSEMQPIVQEAARAERDVLEARGRFAEALATLEEKVGAPVRP